MEKGKEVFANIAAFAKNEKPSKEDAPGVASDQEVSQRFSDFSMLCVLSDKTFLLALTKCEDHNHALVNLKNRPLHLMGEWCRAGFNSNNCNNHMVQWLKQAKISFRDPINFKQSTSIDFFHRSLNSIVPVISETTGTVIMVIAFSVYYRN